MNWPLVLGAGFVLVGVGVAIAYYLADDRGSGGLAEQESQAYLRALLELIDGNADAAIEELTAAIQRNTDRVDAYFALGTLFRERGEFERAIRVHQAVLMRRNLPKATQLSVHLQLARDFHAAGFRKRAITALHTAVVENKNFIEGLRELAKLYEEVGDWEQAAWAYARLGKVSGDRGATADHLMHLHGQLAEEALLREDLNAAQKHLKRAAAGDDVPVQVLHLVALYQYRRGNPAGAAKQWEHALAKTPDLAAFFVPKLEEVFFATGQFGQVAAVLDRVRERHPHSVHLKLARLRHSAKHKPEEAAQLLSNFVEEYPDLLAAHREAALSALASDDAASLRIALQQISAFLQRRDEGYRCTACGQGAADLFWRCPRCQTWGTGSVAWGRRRGERAATHV